MTDPQITFNSASLLTALLGTAFTIAAASGAVAFTLPRIAGRVLPRPEETHLGDFLPFESLEPDGKTVRCRDGTLCQFVAISGVDQGFLDYGEAMALTQARKNLYDALAEFGATLRIFTFRDPIELDPGTSYPNKYATEIARRWNMGFQRAFTTRAVICISLRDPRRPERLEEAVTAVESQLQPYRPVVLTQNPNASPTKDLTIGTFLGRLASPVTRPNPRGAGETLSDAIAADEVTFLKDGRIRFRGADAEKYCSVIGLRRLGDYLDTRMAEELAAIPAEMTILQVIQPQPKAESLIKLKHQKNMVSSASFSEDVAQQYEEAIRIVEGMDEFRASLCHFSQVIFLFAATEAELAEAEKSCRQILTAHGITPVREKGATQASWFMQFASIDLKPRTYRLLSAHAAMAVTFDRPPTGLPRSDWGQGPIALFHTGANTIYSHQFHASPEPRAVGHGICIAPTGAGKTVLMEFLSCMASRHRNVRHFFFDRFQGTYIYTTAMNGKYLSFNADKQILSVDGGMNPFQCDPTPENIDFLKVWLQALSRCDDYDSIEQIGHAIEIAFDLDKEERSLAAIYEGAFTPGSKLRKELQKWVDPSLYGKMFNAERDCIDLDGNWLTTFDMTVLLNDQQLAGPAVHYMMHRIRQAMRRNDAPGFIFVDETEPLLRDEQFKKLYYVALQEFRKIGGVVCSVFQRPEALRASGISELIRQQCSTYYLFQNPGAHASDYDEFQLTEKELGFIMGHTQTARRAKRAILVKRPATGESVVLDVDLSPLGPYLRVFSSSSRDVKLVNDLQRQFGAAWVDKLIDYEAP